VEVLPLVLVLLLVRLVAAAVSDPAVSDPRGAGAGAERGEGAPGTGGNGAREPEALDRRGQQGGHAGGEGRQGREAQEPQHAELRLRHAEIVRDGARQQQGE
jgi:hypothetical protein